MTITAVFGVDDFTTADIECFEAADGCDIEVSGIGAIIAATDAADICQIYCGALVTMPLVEAGDSCGITGQIGTVVVLPSTTDRFTVVAPAEQFLVRLPKQEELETA